MKFQEKLISLRKQKGLSQEELGLELHVSRQTVSKWESGQSYPDFQRLVLLSDYFGISLDALVKDVDLQNVGKNTWTDEPAASLYGDVQQIKKMSKRLASILSYGILALAALVLLGFFLHLLFPDIPWLWGSSR